MVNYQSIATFLQLQQAHLAKIKLESEGINVFLQDELMLYSLAGGGITLQVEEENAENALRILSECGYV